jgi:hypothetical protein
VVTGDLMNDKNRPLGTRLSGGPEEQSFGMGSAPAAMIVAPSQIPNKRMENVATASEICFHGKAEIKQEYFDELSVRGLASIYSAYIAAFSPGRYG